MPNVVNIVVTSENRTAAGFGEATRGLHGIGTMAIEAGAAVATALAGMAVDAVKMASQFDSEMMKLHTQAGVSADQIKGLSQDVLNLAGQVGQSPDSLAMALFHVESNFASLGISSQKAMELVKIAAEGASVGGADLVDVTNALTAAVASGIPGVEDFSKAMGVLNATVGAGDMTMQDLASALGSGLLATVKGYGLSIKDVSAALATFGDNNIRGKVAATDLRMAVQSLAVPTKDGKGQLISWGVAANQLALDMQQHGLLFALEHLQQLFKQNGITATQQGDIITTMFGKKAGVGLAVLMGQMDRLKSKYPDLDKGANSFGDAWASTNKTLKQQWAELKAGFDAFMIKMGERITPLIEKAIPAIKNGWESVRKTFVELNNVFHFDEMFVKIKAASEEFVAEFKKDWPQIRPLAILLAFAIGMIAEGILAVVLLVAKMDTKMLTVWKGLSTVVVDFTRFFLASMKDIADAAAWAFGWIPGIGPKVKEAAKHVDDFVDQTNKSLNKLINPTVTIRVGAETVGSLAAAVITSLGAKQTFGVAGHASGGIAGGLVRVGERGPELVNLPQGSHVLPNGNAAGTSAGAGQPAQIESVISFDSGIDTAFGTYFMNALRQGKIVIKQRYITA